MNLRPSSLPKLDQCARFEGNLENSAPARRGNAMDTLYRLLLKGGGTSAEDVDALCEVAGLKPDDVDAVLWAVQASRRLADGQPILSQTNDVRIEACGMSGTADACCPSRRWSADVKSGQEYDYTAQQAAYALGFMDRELVTSWTVYLLYADLRKIVTLRFEREAALSLIRGIVAKVKDPLVRATPCDYCCWCRHRWTCRERLEPLSMLLAGAPQALDLAAIAQDPARLGALLSITHDIARQDGLHDYLRDAAKAHLERGTEVPGFGLIKNREIQTPFQGALKTSHRSNYVGKLRTANKKLSTS